MQCLPSGSREVAWPAPIGWRDVAWLSLGRVRRVSAPPRPNSVVNQQEREEGARERRKASKAPVEAGRQRRRWVMSRAEGERGGGEAECGTDESPRLVLAN
jgi:hypothetical protein